MESFLMPYLHPPGAPRLSYGQESGILLLLVLAPLGVVASLSALLDQDRSTIASALVAVIGSIPSVLLLAAMWFADTKRNGYNSTTLILYPVPFLTAAGVLSWSCVIVTRAARSRYEQWRGRE